MYPINSKTLSKGKSYKEHYNYRVEYGKELTGFKSYYQIDKKLQEKVNKMLNELKS